MILRRRNLSVLGHSSTKAGKNDSMTSFALPEPLVARRPSTFKICWCAVREPLAKSLIGHGDRARRDTCRKGYAGISVLAFRLIFSVHLYTILYWRNPPRFPRARAPEEPVLPFLRTPTPEWPHRRAISQKPLHPRLLCCPTCLQRQCLPTLRAQAGRQAVPGSPRTESA